MDPFNSFVYHDGRDQTNSYLQVGEENNDQLVVVADPTLNIMYTHPLIRPDPLEKPCICGCNAHYMYYPQKPKTMQEWHEFYSGPMCWEEPNLSRYRYPSVWSHDVVTQEIFLDFRLAEINKSIEYCTLVVMRAIPEYAKRVRRMFVGSMDPALWAYWVTKMTAAQLPTKNATRGIRVPCHQPQKRKETVHHVGWEQELPPLSTPCWWLKKWATREGGLFRAKISSLKVIHNSYNWLVRVEFNYTTEFYDKDGIWRSF